MSDSNEQPKFNAFSNFINKVLFKGDSDTAHPPVTDILNRVLTNSDIAQLLTRVDWGGWDLYQLKNLLKPYQDEGEVVPFSQDWMRSTQRGNEVWVKTVKILRNLAMIIGDVDGVEQDDEALKQSLENEVEQLVLELSQLGVSKATRIQTLEGKKTLLDFAQDSEQYVIHYAATVLKQLPDTSVHYQQIRPGLGEFDELNEEEGDFDEARVGSIKADNISEPAVDWHAAAGVLHIATAYLDCDNEIKHGF